MKKKVVPDLTHNFRAQRVNEQFINSKRVALPGVVSIIINLISRALRHIFAYTKYLKMFTTYLCNWPNFLEPYRANRKALLQYLLLFSHVLIKTSVIDGLSRALHNAGGWENIWYKIKEPEAGLTVNYSLLSSTWLRRFTAMMMIIPTRLYF